MEESWSPVEDLLVDLNNCLGGWLVRRVVAVAQRSGSIADEQVALLSERAAAIAVELLADLHDLLQMDPDEQRTNPLDLIRRGLHPATRALDDLGIEPSLRDPFDVRTLPDDRHSLAPMTWADIDERLVESGLRWGAWKASVILRRRREEGLR